MRIEHFSLPTYNIICNYSFMLSLSSHFPWEQGACMVPSSRRNWKHCSIVLVCLSHQGHCYECMVIVLNSLYVFSLYHAPSQLDISCIMTQSIVHISCMSSVYPTMTQRPDRAMEGGPQPHVIRWLPCIYLCMYTESLWTCIHGKSLANWHECQKIATTMLVAILQSRSVRQKIDVTL